MPYVNQRWLGGMLTNFATVSSRVKRMQDLRTMQAAGDFDGMPKREALRHVRELEKLTRNLGGISGLDRLPDAIFVVDTKKEHIAVTEANKLRLPVVAVVDTNCDPDVIDYVIPGNDDAIRSASLMCRVVADAVAEGRWIASHRPAPSRPESNGGAPSAPSPPRPRPRANVDASHPAPPLETPLEHAHAPTPADVVAVSSPLSPDPHAQGDLASPPGPVEPAAADPAGANQADPAGANQAEPAAADPAGANPADPAGADHTSITTEA
jgi:small subunit ribosomal protein S2